MDTIIQCELVDGMVQAPDHFFVHGVHLPGAVQHQRGDFLLSLN
jgi:hypothetical protein